MLLAGEQAVAVATSGSVFRSAGRSCTGTSATDPGAASAQVAAAAGTITAQTAFAAAAWSVTAQTAQAAFAAAARTIAEQTATNPTTADAFASAGGSGHCGVAAAGVTSAALAAKHAAEQIDPEALVTEASAKNQRTNQHVPFHRTTSPYTMNF